MGNKLTISSVAIDGAFVVESQSYGDERGSFTRLFCIDELSEIIGKRKIVQINASQTAKIGTIRGLHMQKPPYSEMKFVRCTRGAIMDVFVDLRRGSSSFLKWFSVELNDVNKRMLVIPEGCAHGFQTLSDNVEILYLHTKQYQPDAEFGVRYDEPLIKISWPMPASFISARDRNFNFLDANFDGY